MRLLTLLLLAGCAANAQDVDTGVERVCDCPPALELREVSGDCPTTGDVTITDVPAGAPLWVRSCYTVASTNCSAEDFTATTDGELTFSCSRDEWTVQWLEVGS